MSSPSSSPRPQAAASARKRGAPSSDLSSDADDVPKKKSKQDDGVRAYCFTMHFKHGLVYAPGSVILPLNDDGAPHLPVDMCNIDADGSFSLKEGFLLFEPLALHEKMCFLTYQLERCPDTGKPHFQGYVEFKKRQRKTAVIKLLPSHLETRHGTPKQAIDYCHEAETRIGDGQPVTLGVPIRDGVSYKFDEVVKAIDAGEDVDAVDSPFRVEYAKKMFIFDALLARRRKPSKAQCRDSVAAPPLTHLRVWQQAIVDIVKAPPEPRIVYWITDRKGSRGKTTLTRHLVDEFDALSLGSSTEMTNAAYTWSGVCGKCRIVIFDIDRSAGMQGQYSCTIMERLKDGLMNNTKYQSGMLRFPPPHVLVFSNFMPDVNRLSLDRWRIFELDDSEELIDVTDATIAAAAAAPAVYNAFPAAAAAVPAQNAQWPGFASS